MENSRINHVSDTAFWVAKYRALETERKDAVFRDPLAKVLIGERDFVLLRNFAEISKYTQWSLITRTSLIDQLIQKYIQQGCTTILNLGAGLDTRPYRLPLPKNLTWIEIDFSDINSYKNEKLAAEKPQCHLERISLDLSNDDERIQCLKKIATRSHSILVLTEGVIPYLTELQVSKLANDLSQTPNINVWITDYYSTELYKRFQSKAFNQFLQSSPFRFFPPDYFSFFKSNGWKKKEMHYLYDEGVRLKRPFPIPWFIKPIKLLAPVKLAEKLRLQAFVVFEKDQ